MECRCNSCQLYPLTWVYQERAIIKRETTPELTKRIEDLAIELSTHTEEGASASYAIFYTSLTSRLTYLPTLTEDLTHAFEHDITTLDHTPVPESRPSPRSSPKIEKILRVVSISLSHAKQSHLQKCSRWIPRDVTQERELSTFPTFLPLFKEVLKSLPILTDQLWAGIYCGAVNAIANEFVEDRLSEDNVSLLFPRTEGQRPDDHESFILSAKESIKAAKETSAMAEGKEIALSRAMVEKVWGAGSHDSLMHLHQLVANRIGIALSDLLQSETASASK